MKRTFKGGHIFGKIAGSPKPELCESSLPDKVIIPLQQGFGEEVLPIVKIGDKVGAGQIIGIDDNSLSSPIHATVSGTVEDIRAIKRLGQEIGAVFIKSDGSNDLPNMDLPPIDPKNSSPDEVAKVLYLSGVASLGRVGFPTSYGTSPLQPGDVDSLIISAVYSEPFALSNQILLDGKINKFLDGVDFLRRSLPNRVEVYIGINERDREIIKNSEWLHVCPLKLKYPQDHDVILAQTILGRGVPYGGCISDLRAVVMDVQAALHAYEAVMEGRPVIERIVALGGSGLKESLFFKVRVGTPLGYIVESRMKNTENRCIYGGIITGAACDDFSMPIDRTASSIAVLEENKDREFLSFLRPGADRDSFSNTFLSSLFPIIDRNMHTNMNGEQRPCIYCNYCESVCPSGLRPYLLSKYVTHDMVEEADKHRILSCIDCGLCTYVCPSKLPLMEHIHEGKIGIRKDKEK